MLLIALFKPSASGTEQLYYYCPTSSKKLPNKVYNIKDEVTRLGADMCELLLIIPSAIFNKDKVSIFNLVRNSANLRVLLKIFNTPNANDLNITTAGESFFLEIYKGENLEDLNEPRFQI